MISLTLIIVIITCVVSYVCFNNRELFNKLSHRPYREYQFKEYYRFLSSGFVHGSWVHLGINMFVLYSFGQNSIEPRFEMLFGPMLGKVYYILLYIITIVAADIPTFLKHKNNPSYASIGASGAVSGILFVSVLFAPWQKIYLYGIIGIPGIIAAVAYLMYSSYASKKGGDGIDHDAHFYGAVFGFLFTIALKPSLFMDFVNKLSNVSF